MEQYELTDIRYNLLTETKSFQIDETIFLKIKEKIIFTLNKLNIPTDNLSIYYERYNNKTSILAIKLTEGDNLDLSNYMINWCQTNYSNNKISCDIGFDAKAKVGTTAMNIANMITEDIILFFESLEQNILENNLSSVEFNIRIPLGTSKQEKTNKKENPIKSKIRRLFKK